MFRSASLFIGTSFTVAVYTIFCNIKCRLDRRHSPQNIFNAKNFNPHKKPISLLNVPICTQGMQRTWWPEAGTIIVTGPYCIRFAIFWCWIWNIAGVMDQYRGRWRPGDRFNIKMSSNQYRKCQCGDKTVVRICYLHNGISYSGKMT